MREARLAPPHRSDVERMAWRRNAPRRRSWRAVGTRNLAVTPKAPGALYVGVVITTPLSEPEYRVARVQRRLAIGQRPHLPRSARWRRKHRCRSVTSFSTGSSAPSARRCAAGGASAASSRTQGCRSEHTERTPASHKIRAPCWSSPNGLSTAGCTHFRAADPTDDDVHAAQKFTTPWR